MRESLTRTDSKIPILGDIPLIGAFFRSRENRREKSELVVFLTPTIVRSTAQVAELTEAARKRIKGVPGVSELVPPMPKAPESKDEEGKQ
jgi:general secretion pathway protein D